MYDTACRAVAQAGTVAATASLDSEQPWPLLLVAGWLTTATDCALAAGHLAELEAAFAV
jgi:hypothetical protein